MYLYFLHGVKAQESNAIKLEDCSEILIDKLLKGLSEGNKSEVVYTINPDKKSLISEAEKTIDEEGKESKITIDFYKKSYKEISPEKEAEIKGILKIERKTANRTATESGQGLSFKIARYPGSKGGENNCIVEDTNLFDEINKSRYFFDKTKINDKSVPSIRTWLLNSLGLTIFMIVFGLLGVLLVGFNIWMLVDAATTKKPINKALWICLIILVPFAQIIYLFVVKVKKS